MVNIHHTVSSVTNRIRIMVNISLGRSLYVVGLCLLLFASTVSAQSWSKYEECNEPSEQALPFKIKAVKGRRAILANRCQTFSCVKRRVRSRSTVILKWLQLPGSDKRFAGTFGTMGYAKSVIMANEDNFSAAALVTVGLLPEDNLNIYDANSSLDIHYLLVNTVRCEMDAWCERHIPNELLNRCYQEKDTLPRLRQVYKGPNDLSFGEVYASGIR